MIASLVASALVSFASFVFLVWVGWAVGQRPATSHDDARLAGWAFGGFWYTWAAISGSSGVTKLLAATAEPPLTLVVGLQFLTVAALCMGLAGLLYYLGFLYTGRTTMFWPLVVAYALAAGALLRTIASWAPSGLETTPLETTLVYARPASEATSLAMIVVLIGPQLLASLALFMLASRLPNSASRVRLLVVASAILGWFGSAFLGVAFGIEDGLVWGWVQLLTPLVGGLCVLLVHRPPPWLERHLPPELAADSTPTTATRSG